uniref:Uncharacterized protein n=1 Tax=Tetraselmis chuii TaxID=63592 RepID=A0A7S1T1H1_9CHLO|mmetsp:Transcript_39560/g.70928  ORF Transcript_39560/g.70928 Transcript_39560/m.70928 type:complete len:1187 (+) Transcript_39560:121-3681(+)
MPTTSLHFVDRDGTCPGDLNTYVTCKLCGWKRALLNGELDPTKRKKHRQNAMKCHRENNPCDGLRKDQEEKRKIKAMKVAQAQLTDEAVEANPEASVWEIAAQVEQLDPWLAVCYLRPNAAGGMPVKARVTSVDNDDEGNGAPAAYTVTGSDGTVVVLSEDELRDEFNLGSYDFLDPQLGASEGWSELLASGVYVEEGGQDVESGGGSEGGSVWDDDDWQDSEDNDDVDDYNEELHIGAPSGVTKGNLVANVLQVQLDHDMSEGAVVALLILLQAVLPSCAIQLPKTYQGCTKLIGAMPPQAYERHYCPKCDHVYPDPASHTQATYQALAESAKLGEGKCDCGGARFVTKRHGATFKLIPAAKFYDFRIEDIVQRMLMREDAPIHDSEYKEDVSINSFKASPHGQVVHAAADAAFLNGGADFTIVVDFGADGVQLYKFKFHSTTVYAIRFSNVCPEKRSSNANIEILLVVPGPHEPSNASVFLRKTLDTMELSLRKPLPMSLHTEDKHVRRMVNVCFVLGAIFADYPARRKLSGCGMHGHYFCCLWCLFQGIYFENHMTYMGYLEPSPQNKWRAALNPQALPLGLDRRRQITRDKEAATMRAIRAILGARVLMEAVFIGDKSVQVTDTEREQIIRATVQDRTIPDSLSGAGHVSDFLKVKGIGYSIKDSHVLPLSHATLLGVCKTYLSEILEMSVDWDRRIRKLKTVVNEVYMARAKGADIPSEFGRVPIPIFGSSTLFPNWTIESWLDFMTVYLPLFLWDVFQRLPTHFVVALQSLICAIQHYFRFDMICEARRPGESDSRFSRREFALNNLIRQRRVDAKANMLRFAKLCERHCPQSVLTANLHTLVCRLADQETARGATTRDNETWVERSVRMFRSAIAGRASVEPEQMFARHHGVSIAMETLMQNPVSATRRFIQLVPPRTSRRESSAPEAHVALGMVGAGRCPVQRKFMTLQQLHDLVLHYIRDFHPGLDYAGVPGSAEFTVYARAEEHTSGETVKSQAYAGDRGRINCWVELRFLRPCSNADGPQHGDGTTPAQRASLEYMPVNPDSVAIDRELDVFQGKVNYFLVVEKYSGLPDDSELPPVLALAVSDIFTGQRRDVEAVDTGIWELPETQGPEWSDYPVPFMSEMARSVYGKLVSAVFDGRRRWISLSKRSRRKRTLGNQTRRFSGNNVGEVITGTEV